MGLLAYTTVYMRIGRDGFHNWISFPECNTNRAPPLAYAIFAEILATCESHPQIEAAQLKEESIGI
jgi:hypothetical protein